MFYNFPSKTIKAKPMLYDSKLELSIFAYRNGSAIPNHKVEGRNISYLVCICDSRIKFKIT